jgi:putative transposase
LKGERLALKVTDGCPGLAAALQTVYRRTRHQRCWVHKKRNLLDAVRRQDQAKVKTSTQAIYGVRVFARLMRLFSSFKGGGAINIRPWSSG